MNGINIKYKNIAVLLGGRSQEREISLMTGRAVVNALKKNGCEVDVIDWQGRASISQLLAKNYDCVFIALHGIDGEDGCVQSLLEILGVPYTGSGVLASALCMDKIKAKQLLKANGLPILDDIAITENFNQQDLAFQCEQLGFPLCVKPVNQGSSLGTYRVDKKEDLEQALTDAKNYGDEIMIEPWLTAGEYTVAIVNGEPLPSIKISAKKQFYNYEAKYISKDTDYMCPSDLNAKREQELRRLAKKAFDITGCSDWGRVDFVVNQQGDFYILEINTVPGLTDTSLVPKAAKVNGLDFESLVLKITNNACLKQDTGLLIGIKGDKASA